MDYFNTISKPAIAEFKEKGSRFIGYAYPINSVDQFKNILKELKSQHPKATHHCFAYRIGTDGNTFRSSDDGEPAGTAGKPILNQIDSKNLTDILVVVVRYFGGTMLGKPGLINAYKQTTALALQLTPVINLPILTNYKLTFNYTELAPVMAIIKKYNCMIIDQQTLLFCEMSISIPKNKAEEIADLFTKIINLEISKL